MEVVACTGLTGEFIEGGIVEGTFGLAVGGRLTDLLGWGEGVGEVADWCHFLDEDV